MMTVEHINRRGDKYLLQSGKTKTGKPKYWFGRKLTGTPVEAVPEGYEVYESPESSQVYLRKATPCPFTQAEREVVAAGIRQHAGLKYFLLDLQDKSLILYLPEREPSAAAELLGKIFGDFSDQLTKIEEFTAAHTRYSKMLRFILVNEATRSFAVQRWCFRGAIDDWVQVGRPGSLENLVANVSQHLGQESFYELL